MESTKQHNADNEGSKRIVRFNIGGKSVYFVFNQRNTVNEQFQHELGKSMINAYLAGQGGDK